MNSSRTFSYSDAAKLPPPVKIRLRGPCGGYTDEYLMTGHCSQIVVRTPVKTCDINFQFTASQSQVCQVFCGEHRYCFFPLPNGERCSNLRRSPDSNYCLEHANKDKECGELVGNYHAICGNNLQRCSSVDDQETLEKKEDVFSKCHAARDHHNKQCIHDTADDKGHKEFMKRLKRDSWNCNNLLWHEAKQVQEGGGISDMVDIFT